MKEEILKRKFWEKFKIIKQLYFSAAIIFLITFVFLCLFKYFPISNEFKNSIFTHKKILLELFATNFRNVSLFFIGIVVGSYSIVQALLDEESLEILTTSKDNKSSKFTYINIYFYSYVIILLLTIVINGTIEVVLKMDKELNFIKNLTLNKKYINFIFYMISSIQISLFFSISYEFKTFIRNLYDTFKITTYIKITRKMDTKEKVLFINKYLFDKHMINYLESYLSQDAYCKMKKIIGKDFTLDEAVRYIKKEQT